MTKPNTPDTIEGLDREISALRTLISKAVSKQEEATSLNDLINLLNSVGTNSLQLARTLKIRMELEKEQNSPAAILHQALKELEEEWPEFRELTRQFTPNQEENKP